MSRTPAMRTNQMNLTYRYRIKDGSVATRRALRLQARSVNFVWNYLCEIQREAERRWQAGANLRWPSAFDLTHLAAGCTIELGLHADTVAAICHRFTASRNEKKRCPRWRSARKNLDWIPINNGLRAFQLAPGRVTFRKRHYHLWWSRDLPDDANVRIGSFACDSRGRWYFNITIAVADGAKREGPAVGIDLGLKHLATLSDGRKIEMPAFYRQAEAELAKWQRFGKKKRTTALAAKVANQRKHFLHVVSTGLVRDYGRIVVGDVSPSRLGKTRMAKSIHDAGWAMLRDQLHYKARKHGVGFEVVDERMTSQVCSECGTLPPSRPKGIADLGVRQWECSDCGALHDRDVNAARNILRAGAECRPPAVGIAPLTAKALNTGKGGVAARP